MNFLPTVEMLQVEDIFDEEEFFSSADQAIITDWSPTPPEWLGAVRGGVRPADIAEIWQNKADDKLLHVFALWLNKADAVLREQTLPMAQGQPDDQQLRLAITDSFVPSPELIASWRENASQFVNREAIARAKITDASAEFSSMLKRLIGAFAQEKRYSGMRAVLIADQSGEFDTHFQLDVSERFLLVPQKSGKFFALLHRDLLECAPDIYSGGWGSFVRKPDRTLQLELAAPNRVRRDGFVKARETRR